MEPVRVVLVPMFNWEYVSPPQILSALALRRSKARLQLKSGFDYSFLVRFVSDKHFMEHEALLSHGANTLKCFEHGVRIYSQIWPISVFSFKT